MEDKKQTVEAKGNSTSALHSHGGPAGELIAKTPKKRVIGISRKILLRTINRKIVVRLARRATIGIPILGLYLGQKVFRNDLHDAVDPQLPASLRHKYKALASIDAIDLTAQSLMLAGMTTTIFFQCQEIADINIAAVMKDADKVSLSAALGSTLFGTYLEILKQNFLTNHQQHDGEETGEDVGKPSSKVDFTGKEHNHVDETVTNAVQPPKP